MTAAPSSGTSFCPACGGETPRRARYCPECAAPLSESHWVSCPACESANSIRARFCSECGAHLASVAEAERRVITVLFADLTGFTALAERLDPEQVRKLVVHCLEPLCQAVTRWGGFVDKFIGDCVMALFGAPVAYENEEERAIRAALDMQAELMRFRSEEAGLSIPAGHHLQLTIGINTGTVVTGVFSGGGARNYTALGDTVNVAARLDNACQPGEILVGSTTYELTRHIFEFGEEQLLQVKGKQEPVRARGVLGVRSERGRDRGFEGREIPLVGRAAEVESVRRRWAEARSGRFQQCLLLGAPGIGKSRLVEELARTEGLAHERVAVGRSFPYASGIPWEPIARLLRQAHGLSGDLPAHDAASAVAERSDGDWGAEAVASLAVALGASVADAPELAGLGSHEVLDRVGDAVLRALEDLGSEPRVLVLEDLHWADNATLEFLASLPDRGPRGSLLLLLVSRTPLPGEDRLAAFLQRMEERVEVGPLSREESFRLVEAVLGPHRLPESFLDRTVGRAEGNPLFIEEMLKSLQERDLIQRREGFWEAVGDLNEVQVPDTVESLLSTRIDGLSPSEKRVLQYASIVGRHFWSGVLREVLVQHPVDEELERLLRGEIVRALPESFVEGDREYMFESLLVQEVAYEGLLRTLRAELHGSVARWLEQQLHGRTGESDELIAFHYERSFHKSLAVPYLERCSRRARARGALSDAYGLARRALDLSEGEAEKLAVVGMVEDIAAAMGDLGRWSSDLEELEELAERRGDPESRGDAAFRRARYLLESGKLRRAKRAAESALELLRGAGSPGRIGDVHSLLGRVFHLWGDYEEAKAHYEAALPLLQATGDRAGELVLRDRLGLVEVDLDDFCRALKIFDEVLEVCREQGQRVMEARVHTHRATALRWLGRYEEGEATAREALEVARRTGSRSLIASAETTLGFVLAAAGDGEARDWLRSATEKARAVGRPALEARAWMSLSEVEAGEDAEEAAARARELSARTGLVHIDILARTRQAELALSRGEAKRADRLSAVALRRMRRHGSIQGPEEVVLYVRSQALRAAGEEGEAAFLLLEARDLLHEKADRIPHPAMRETFLEVVRPNPEILAAAGRVTPA